MFALGANYTRSPHYAELNDSPIAISIITAIDVIYVNFFYASRLHLDLHIAGLIICKTLSLIETRIK